MAAQMVKTGTPGIFKKGNRYVVVWRYRGKQHKSYHRTMAEAQEEKGRRQAGERRPASRLRFDEYAEKWIDTYTGRTARGLSERTRAMYRRSIVERAVPFFRTAKLAEIAPPDVREFIRYLEAEGLSPSTVRGEVAPLRALFATALEDGLLRSNPAAGVRIIGKRDDGEEEEKARAMTRAELGRLLAHLPEEWRLFFEFLAHSGLRISEAIGLRWSDVEFGKRPRVKVRSQLVRGNRQPLKSTYSRRDVPLSPSMARRLWRLRGSQADDAPVFATATGTPLMDGNVRRRVLEPARDAAGLEWVGFHSFRHACASLQIAKGRTPVQVQKWLGHHSPAFTLERYAHLMDDGVGDADFMDDAVKVGNPRATQGPATAEKDPGAEAAEIAV